MSVHARAGHPRATRGRAGLLRRARAAPRLRDSRLAIVPVDCGDGYPRAMSGAAQMLVRGHRCDVVGTITMDVCMLDVTDLPGVRVGEEVTLLGRQGLGAIDLYELAGWAGTVPYEITCGISKRVPRRYVGG
ncbi:MAG: alanine racemase C-terminal domain-containing protein [Nannocystaceae bacterium]